MSEQHYDIIGDVHGRADALRRLLLKLGYTESQDVFRHNTRKVIFVGDFVDRGPDQKGILRIARNMCEADTASSILGKPAITFSNAACLDFSVARKGYLTDYTWSGELVLSNEQLVYVTAESPAAID